MGSISAKRYQDVPDVLHAGVMTNKRDAAHVKQLDDLEQSKADGTISVSEYDIRRAKVLAETSERPMNVGVAILVIAGVLVVLLIVARILVASVSGQ